MLKPGDVRPGMPLASFTAEDYRSVLKAVREAKEPKVAAPLEFVGDRITLARPEGFWATLSGASSPYSFTEKYGATGGVWTTRVRTGTTNAYEVNGKAGLSGKTVFLRPGYPGEYLFQSSSVASSCTGTVTVNVKCGGTNVASATVTISQGGTTYATGTTNGSGNFSTTALPASGTYDISVSKTGFVTYTGTFSYSCSSITVNVVLPSSANVISGVVGGCGGNLAGALVVATQGVTTLGTATTNGSGAYSITLSGWSSGAVTLTASKTRYSNGSTVSTPLACGSTTTANIVLTPATDYYCDPCGGTVPIYKTLYLTQPWDGAIVALTAGGGGWGGTGTWTGTGYTDCGSATTSSITITVSWTFSNACSVTLQWKGCAAPNTSRNPISDAYAAANPGSVTNSTIFDISPTHTNSPFSVSSTLTGYMGGGSGTATITE